MFFLKTIYNNPGHAATLPHYIMLNGKIHPKMKIVIYSCHFKLVWLCFGDIDLLCIWRKTLYIGCALQKKVIQIWNCTKTSKCIMMGVPLTKWVQYLMVINVVFYVLYSLHRLEYHQRHPVVHEPLVENINLSVSEFVGSITCILLQTLAGLKLSS